MSRNTLFLCCAYAALIVFFTLLLVLNILYALMPGDDFLYSFAFPDQGIIGSERIDSLGGFVRSQINHYVNYNYRILPHLLLQVTLLFPFVFDLFNSMVFFLIPYIMLRDIPISNKRNGLVLFLLTLCSLWLFHPDIVWSYFWQSGSHNYSWMLPFQLLFVQELLKVEKGSHNSTWLYVTAFLTALGNEHVIFSLIVFCVLLLLMGHARKATVHCLLILLAGAGLMFFSPSFAERLNNDILSSDTGVHLFENLQRLLYYLLFCTAVYLVFRMSTRMERLNRNNGKLLLLFGISLIPGLISPLFEARIFSFSFVLFMLIVLRSVIDLHKKSTIMVFVLFILGLSAFYNRGLEFKGLFEAQVGRSIYLSKSGNQDTIAIGSFCQTGCFKSKNCDDITKDPNHFHNLTTAAFYNKKAIVLRDDSYKIPDSLLYQDAFQDDMKSHKTDFVMGNGLTLDSIYSYTVENGDLIYVFVMDQSEKGPNTQVILRAQTKSLTHYLASFLPAQIKFVFMSFLEKDLVLKERDGKLYAAYLMKCPDQFHRLYLSAYDLSKHNAVGPIYSFKPSEFNKDSKASE